MAAFGAFERMMAFRYLRARRQEGFISIIAWFSLLGIGLGVATLIIVIFLLFIYGPMIIMAVLSFQGRYGGITFPFKGPFQGSWWQSLVDSSVPGSKATDIGTTAIQLAKAFGARVITTVRNAEKAAAVTKLGADHAILYKDNDWAAEVKKKKSKKGGKKGKKAAASGEKKPKAAKKGKKGGKKAAAKSTPAA